MFACLFLPDLCFRVFSFCLYVFFVFSFLLGSRVDVVNIFVSFLLPTPKTAIFIGCALSGSEKIGSEN